MFKHTKHNNKTITINNTTNKQNTNQSMIMISQINIQNNKGTIYIYTSNNKQNIQQTNKQTEHKLIMTNINIDKQDNWKTNKNK